MTTAGKASGDKSDLGRLLEMINGYQRTSVIVAALQLGVFEQLRRATSEEALAAALGAHAPSLKRLLRALHVLGLVDRREDGVHLTSMGKLLLEDSFGPRPWAVLVGEEYMHAWARLGEAVRTGENAFERVFGMRAWQHREAHPELDHCFNRVTSGVQLRTIAALLDAYDFSKTTCLVDVGGGHGNLLAGILKRHRAARGILFDQPHVVANATATLDAAGVLLRCTVVGGSFLEAVPPGGDVLLLKHCLHNWSDADCVRILASCREAMAAGAELLVVEDVIPDDDLRAAGQVIMLDIHMLVVHGGVERTRAEYERLFRGAGLRLDRELATRPGVPNVLVVKK